MTNFRLKILLLSIASCMIMRCSYAWGPTGHSIVAQIAMHFLSDSVRNKVNYYLQNMSMEDAGNWMDSMRSNPDYDFMKPWHYIDIEKEKNISRAVEIIYW